MPTAKRDHKTKLPGKFEELVRQMPPQAITDDARYESTIEVDFYAKGDETRMVVTLHGMHDAQTSGMQVEGFTSQLSKLDDRYSWAKPA